MCVALLIAPTTHAQSLTEDCEHCHGSSGVSLNSDIPTIAGMSAYYIEDSFIAYANKTRRCAESNYQAGPHKGDIATMCDVVAALSDEQTASVAVYFSEQSFVPAKQTFDPTLAQRGA